MITPHQYSIEYLKDGVYILIGYNPLNKSKIVLAKSDSPSKLLEHGYLDLGISQQIEMSGVMTAIMDLETMQSMGGIKAHEDLMNIIQKLIEGLIDKKIDEGYNNYE